MTAANLLISGVSKNLRTTVAVDEVSLWPQGGVTTLLGANGAGKTTLLRCVATALRPDAGEIIVDGLNAAFATDRTEIRRRLGYQPQSTAFNERSRVFDVIDYVAVLKELGSERARRAELYRKLELVGLAARAADRVGDLSGGMRQRLGLAQALLGRTHPGDPRRTIGRTRSGRYRCLGSPPQGAERIEPTIEDGYLTVVTGQPVT